MDCYSELPTPNFGLLKLDWEHFVLWDGREPVERGMLRFRCEMIPISSFISILCLQPVALLGRLWGLWEVGFAEGRGCCGWALLGTAWPVLAGILSAYWLALGCNQAASVSWTITAIMNTALPVWPQNWAKRAPETEEKCCAQDSVTVTSCPSSHRKKCHLPSSHAHWKWLFGALGLCLWCFVVFFCSAPLTFPFWWVQMGPVLLTVRKGWLPYVIKS